MRKLPKRMTVPTKNSDQEGSGVVSPSYRRGEKLGIRTRHDFGPLEGIFKASIQHQLAQRAHGWLGTLRKK